MNFVNRLLALFRRDIRDLAKEGPSQTIDFARLEQTLNYPIQNQSYFTEALSHRSILQISGNESIPSNERLEFLGDAVLSLVVAEYLFHIHPDAEEGELTKIRSRLVNRKALSTYAYELNLGSFLLMSQSAAQVEGKGMETILSDAFEAIIGAIYIDGGYQHAKKFIESEISAALAKQSVKIEDENFKSQLLEMAQSQGLGSPRYSMTSQEGPDHDRTFTIEVYIGNVSYGIGIGKNKKDAEQAAAEKAFRRLLETSNK